ncbi:unnamed protein product [Timema podura]|uniref:Uncharacterized protein n=1 Tax=Timema podura TaxID=61482 RepID=A0ABN7P5M9_TIMPD|nr:unnamed protein product [Timema podura]
MVVAWLVAVERVVNEKAVLKQDEITVIRKRKRGQLPYKKLNTADNKNGSQVFTRAVGPLSRRRKFISSQPVDTLYHEGDALVNSVIVKEEERCFVCEKQVSDGTPLETLTTTSKAPMRHRLDRIAAGARGHLDLSQDPGGVLCYHCTCVLNHLDQIEVELNLLTKSVLNALLKKYGLAALVNDEGGYFVG